jgi:hypothetical protein
VGLPGLEPGTSSLSEMRSNHLSYRPGEIRAGKRLPETRRVNLQYPVLPDKPRTTILSIEDGWGAKYNPL